MPSGRSVYDCNREKLEIMRTQQQNRLLLFSAISLLAANTLAEYGLLAYHKVYDQKTLKTIEMICNQAKKTVSQVHKKVDTVLLRNLLGLVYQNWTRKTALK